VISDAADQIAIRTSTDAAGLLVLSEIYYPAWNAYVDGQPVRTYVADEALRAVAVPSGEHVVQLRFESTTLSVGIFISGVSTLLLAVIWLAPINRRRAAGRRGPQSLMQRDPACAPTLARSMVHPVPGGVTLLAGVRFMSSLSQTSVTLRVDREQVARSGGT
jgi:hypothetical protein